MAGPLAMTERERRDFLAGVHVGVISIERHDRAPLAAPVWYVYTPEKGLSVVTERRSRKGVALEAAGRFSLVAQQEEMPYRYVTVEGPIVEMRPADLDADRRPMAWRYVGEELGNVYVESSGDAVDNWLYRMQPEVWLSLDYAKLAPPGP